MYGLPFLRALGTKSPLKTPGRPKGNPYKAKELTNENDVIGLSVGCSDLRVDGDGRELGDDAGPDDDRSPEERRHGLVHQRVSLDEVQVGVF